MMKLPTVEDLFNAGAHFGHQKSKSHPKTKEVIFDVINGVYIIDLDRSRAMLESAASFVKNQASQGKTILLIGTKRQAKGKVEEVGKALEIPYIINKWLGGTLTNFTTIKSSLKKLEDLVAETEAEDWGKKSKKTQAMVQTQIDRLHRNLDGIKKLEKVPDLLLVVDIAEEKTAVAEAKKMGIKVVGLADTNADYSIIDYPIVVNDDSFKTIDLVLNTLAEAIGEGKKTAPKVESEESSAEDQKSEKVGETKSQRIKKELK